MVMQPDYPLLTAREFLEFSFEEAIDSVDTIVFMDIAKERLRVVQRTGPKGWSDMTHDAPVDLSLPCVNLTIPHEDIFARD